MAEIWFYHLEREPAYAVLPKFLAGCYRRNEAVRVVANDRTMLATVSAALWGADETLFIAHRLAEKDEPPELTVEVHGQTEITHQVHVSQIPETVDGFRRTSVFFESSEEHNVAAARQIWKVLRTQGHALKYWRQNELGRWIDQMATEAAV